MKKYTDFLEAKTDASQTRAIKNGFNELATKLGSKARIGGTAKKIEFQILVGHTSDGYELVQKIDSTRFGMLISKYPQLQDY